MHMFSKMASGTAAVCLVLMSGHVIAADANSGGNTQSNSSNVFSSFSTLLGPSQPTGQPNQDCANFPSTPGNSSAAPGSAFNPGGKAGTVYAGQQPQNQKNTASVSQYDVACSKQPLK